MPFFWICCPLTVPGMQIGSDVVETENVITSLFTAIWSLYHCAISLRLYTCTRMKNCEWRNSIAPSAATFTSNARVMSSWTGARTNSVADCRVTVSNRTILYSPSVATVSLLWVWVYVAGHYDRYGWHTAETLCVHVHAILAYTAKLTYANSYNSRVLSPLYRHYHPHSIFHSQNQNWYQFNSAVKCLLLLKCHKKVTVAHTLLPSVGFRSWSRFLQSACRWRES